MSKQSKCVILTAEELLSKPKVVEERAKQLLCPSCCSDNFFVNVDRFCSVAGVLFTYRCRECGTLWSCDYALTFKAVVDIE